MPTYTAPVRETLFVLNDVLDELLSEKRHHSLFTSHA